MTAPLGRVRAPLGRVRAPLAGGLLAAWLSLASPVAGGTGLDVSWSPARPRPGDALWMIVRGVPAGSEIEAVLGGRPVHVFPDRQGYAALTGVDVDEPAGRRAWRVTVRTDRDTRWAEGELEIEGRQFDVQRLTLPPAMVELDPETERRAVAEAGRLAAVFQTVTAQRLWRGPFARPVAGTEPGTGFGARRIINGKPRAPHTGVDFAAPTGSPVYAANDGRVALVGDFFFPGRLIVLDHGLGVYTLYFHLDRIEVAEGTRVARGQLIGSVGATGRATGPHLHFGLHAGGARIDPETLARLPVH